MERPISTAGLLGAASLVSNTYAPEGTQGRNPDVIASFANGNSLVISSALSRATQTYAKGKKPLPNDQLLRGRILTPTGEGPPFALSSRRDLHALFPDVVASGSRATVVWHYAAADRKAKLGFTQGLRSRTVNAQGGMGRIATVRATARNDETVMLGSDLAVGPTGRIALSWPEFLAKAGTGRNYGQTVRQARVFLSMLR